MENICLSGDLINHLGAPLSTFWPQPPKLGLWFYACYSVTQSYLSLCFPVDCSTPGFPVFHNLPELAQTHVHWVGDAIQPSHPLSSPSPLSFNLSQHQGLFWWVGSLHQVTKVLELQHRFFQINIQGWFPLDLTGLISLQYKGLSRVFSSTTVQKHQFFVPTQGCPLCYLGFPGGSADKESACNAGDLASIPGLGRSPGEGNGNPLQYPLQYPFFFFFPPTLVFLPGESLGQRSLAGYSPPSCKEPDTTEQLSLHFKWFYATDRNFL